MRHRKEWRENLQELAAELSDLYPIGTPCRYWPGVKEGPGTESRLRSVWWVVGSEVVVKVEGYAGGIKRSHVETIEPKTPASIS